MGNLLEYIIPVSAFALLVAGWTGIQFIAKKSGTKNHIDNSVGCCGGCEKKEECSKSISTPTV
jgi:hypothetical protein